MNSRTEKQKNRYRKLYLIETSKSRKIERLKNQKVDELKNWKTEKF